MVGVIKGWLEERGIHWRHHAGRGKRTWVYVGRWTITLERYYWSKARIIQVGMSLGGGDSDRKITFSLGVKGLFTWYLSLDHPWLERITPGEMRDSTARPGTQFKLARKTYVGVRIFDGAIWVSVWENMMEGSIRDSWWWAFHFRPLDFFLGEERVVREKSLEVRAFTVVLPEGKYVGVCDLYRTWWKRPRWPRVKQTTLYAIDLVDPIPVPGKGENEWDLGDDAIWATSGPAQSVNEAIIALLNSVNSARVRYGGPAWVPEPKSMERGG